MVISIEKCEPGDLIKFSEYDEISLVLRKERGFVVVLSAFSLRSTSKPYFVPEGWTVVFVQRQNDGND